MTNSPLTVVPATPEDVAALVRRAQQEALTITVVSGGHGPWSRDVPDGMRIDLTELADIRVEGATVHIGGGATWGAVATALTDAGLAISSGDTASVGVGGLTLGGGIGWMVRSWGLAADQLIGVQLVTAAGEIVEATADENAELLWALKGGGGNFGIVTRFDFAAHHLSGIAYGEYVIGGDAAAVLRTTRDLMRTAPRELTVTYMDVPAMDPSAPAGARLAAVWAGDDADALRTSLAPVAALEGTEAAVTTPAYREILLEMPVPEAGEDAAAPPGFLGGNGLFAELDDDLIDRLVAFRGAYPASVVFLRSLGGAFADVPQETTPFPARSATWFVMAGGFDIPGMIDDDTRAAILAHWREIESGRLAEYGNFADTERPAAVPGMFSTEALKRLRAVKAEWDPHNVFRRNHNIVA
ncbi:FAD-binding oxidoreductase [Microbacterium sp. A93]|uniref:FAD-binding oxidoreductase n=1 Tax=Microbacterium sp. A93 TaxID=3450716 RepID=UPI003F42C667